MHARYEVRKALSVPVELICSDWDEPVALRTADVSPRGCFVASRVLMEPGTPVVVSFRLGGFEEDWTLFGEVARVESGRRRNDSERPGLGIRFLGLGPMERLRLREGLRGVPPPIPRAFRVACA